LNPAQGFSPRAETFKSPQGKFEKKLKEVGDANLFE
jgi:hypothetical protein